MAAKKGSSSPANGGSSPVSSTAVRNTAIPPRTSTSQSSSTQKQPTHEQIAKRAYEIWKSGKGGSAQENWYRAERELRNSF